MASVLTSLLERAISCLANCCFDSLDNLGDRDGEYAGISLVKRRSPLSIAIVIPIIRSGLFDQHRTTVLQRLQRHGRVRHLERDAVSCIRVFDSNVRNRYVKDFADARQVLDSLNEQSRSLLALARAVGPALPFCEVGRDRSPAKEISECQIFPLRALT